MAKRRHHPRLRQQAHRTNLVEVEHHRFGLRFDVAEEGHEAVAAGIGLARHARAAIDEQRGIPLIVTLDGVTVVANDVMIGVIVGVIVADIGVCRVLLVHDLTLVTGWIGAGWIGAGWIGAGWIGAGWIGAGWEVLTAQRSQPKGCGTDFDNQSGAVTNATT